MQHYINSDQSLAFEEFLTFIDARRNNLRAKLQKVLSVTNSDEQL